MTYSSNLCADVGTVNCPCPLAETGDCLICSRLSGKEQCDCSWAGVCVYNEYIQNDGIVRARRKNRKVKIVKKIWYDSDLLVLVLQVTRGFALKAAQPGSFVFLTADEADPFSNVPVSVMHADTETGRISLALKIIAGKTKRIAEEKQWLMLRGVYRSGLLGKGTETLSEDVGIRFSTGMESKISLQKEKKWLVITKGIGLAPAVNLMRWAGDRVELDLLMDQEKINDEFLQDSLRELLKDSSRIHIHKGSLAELTQSLEREKRKNRPALLAGSYSADAYDKVILLTSDYYIHTLSRCMEIQEQKLVYSNNVSMCCGEGICGACSRTDGDGNVYKRCKCRAGAEFVSLP